MIVDIFKSGSIDKVRMRVRGTGRGRSGQKHFLKVYTRETGKKKKLMSACVY